MFILFTALFISLSTAQDLSEIHFSETIEEKLKKLSASPRWLALLYTDQKSQRSILNKNFYLYKKKGWSPIDEMRMAYNAYILNNKDLKRKFPICQYSARYYFLRTQFNKSTTQLNSCSALENFPENFKFSLIYLRSHNQVLGYIRPKLLLSMSNNAKNFIDGKTWVLNDPLADRKMDLKKAKYLFLKRSLTMNQQDLYSYLREISNPLNENYLAYHLNLKPTDKTYLYLSLREIMQTPIDYDSYKKNADWWLQRILQTAQPQLREQASFKSTNTFLLDLTRRKIIKSIENRESIESTLSYKAKKIPKFNLANMRSIVKKAIQKNDKVPNILNLNEKLFLGAYFDYKLLNYSPDDASKIYHQRSPFNSSHTESLKVQNAAHLRHPSQRVSVSMRNQRGGTGEAKIRYQPFQHSFEDLPLGYSGGHAVDFLDISVQTRIEDSDLVMDLDHLYLANLTHLHPTNPISKPYSWRFNAGVDSQSLTRDYLKKNLFTYFDIGRSFFLAENVLTYGLVRTQVEANGRFKDHLSLSNGALFGLRYTFISYLQLRFETGSHLYYNLHAKPFLTQSFDLGFDYFNPYRDFSLHTNIWINKTPKRTYQSIEFSGKYYF